MNYRAIAAIFKTEMQRYKTFLSYTFFAPLVTTSVYFIIFGDSATHIGTIEGISFIDFIIPGMVLLNILNVGIASASYGICFPRYNGSIYEILAAPVYSLDIILGYAGTSSIVAFVVGALTLLTAGFFTQIHIAHPFIALFFVLVATVGSSILGFIAGLVVSGIEKLSTIALLFATPLTLLGGSFFSIKMLPPIWQKVSLLNPVCIYFKRSKVELL